MSVPFTRIGTGQSARLVYQVMGSNGPIFNPTGIRYLPPDHISSAASVLTGNLIEAGAALAGVNLLVSAGTLLLTAQTLAEVRMLSAKADALLAGQERSEAKLDEIIARLERIEIKVSEERLLSALRHAISSSALGDNQVSFAPFRELADDIARFLDDAGIHKGGAKRLILGSDVRACVRMVEHLLRGSRHAIARAYNRASDGDPTRSWKLSPIDTYWGNSFYGAQHSMAFVSAVDSWVVTSLTASAKIVERFTFSSGTDLAFVQNELDDGIIAFADSLLGKDDQVQRPYPFRDWCRSDVSVAEVRNRLAPNHLQHMTAYLTARQLRSDAGQFSVPPDIVRRFVDLGISGEPLERALVGYMHWWLYSTDNGLLWRLLMECRWLRRGWTPPLPAFGIEVSSEPLQGLGDGARVEALKGLILQDAT